MVLMHQDLIDRPFVPHSLISAQENPVPLSKFQMATRVKILMSSGSKKGTQKYYPFFSKNPLQVPQRGPYGKRYPLTGHFLHLLIYLFNISFGVLSKGARHPGAPHGDPLERDAPFLKPSFIHHSKSLAYEPPS
jgi:hypothetical protein